MGLSTLYRALWYVSIGLPLVVALRLAWSHLWGRPYALFAAMLLAGFCRDLALLVPHYSSHTYAVMWEATLPMLLPVQACAAVSLYRAIADLYPRMGRFAVRLFGAALVLTALACIALAPAEFARVSGREAVLRICIWLQRWIASEIAGGLLLAVLFLARFPRPLKRLPCNLVLHAVLLASYFATGAAIALAENVAPLGAQTALEQVNFIIVIGLYLGWTGGLSRAGEQGEPWQQIAPEVSGLVAARERAARELAEVVSRVALRQAAGRR